MRILKIRSEAKSGLSATVDALVERIPDIEEFVDSLSFVHTGSSIMASGEAHYVGIDITLPDLSDEMLVALEPLFKTLLALISEQEGSAISAQVVISDSEGREEIRSILKSDA
ncbi:hypothetical protein OCEANICA350_12808 [Oceanicaulis sp. 350]|nr:hypothetical protein OCEANICA350_12808 [Oceanicaulis sp. 350]